MRLLLGFGTWGAPVDSVTHFLVGSASLRVSPPSEHLSSPSIWGPGGPGRDTSQHRPLGGAVGISYSSWKLLSFYDEHPGASQGPHGRSAPWCHVQMEVLSPGLAHLGGGVCSVGRAVAHTDPGPRSTAVFLQAVGLGGRAVGWICLAAFEGDSECQGKRMVSPGTWPCPHKWGGSPAGAVLRLVSGPGRCGVGRVPAVPAHVLLTQWDSCPSPPLCWPGWDSRSGTHVVGLTRLSPRPVPAPAAPARRHSRASLPQAGAALLQRQRPVLPGAEPVLRAAAPVPRLPQRHPAARGRAGLHGPLPARRRVPHVHRGVARHLQEPAAVPPAKVSGRGWAAPPQQPVPPPGFVECPELLAAGRSWGGNEGSVQSQPSGTSSPWASPCHTVRVLWR